MDDQVKKDQIITELSLLLSNVALPRKGHLDTAAHDRAHVGQRCDSRLVHYLYHTQK